MSAAQSPSLAGVAPETSTPTSIALDLTDQSEYLTPRTPSHLDGPFGSNFDLTWIDTDEDTPRGAHASEMKGHEDEIAEVWGTPELCSALAMLLPSLCSIWCVQQYNILLH